MCANLSGLTRPSCLTRPKLRVIRERGIFCSITTFPLASLLMLHFFLTAVQFIDSSNVHTSDSSHSFYLTSLFYFLLFIRFSSSTYHALGKLCSLPPSLEMPLSAPFLNLSVLLFFCFSRTPPSSSFTNRSS